MADTRWLRPEEREVCEAIFEDTINYAYVRVAEDTGWGNRPWCSPPGWGGKPFYQLHCGPWFFKESLAGYALLAHEMTHVWQGMNNIPYWYVLNSACAQGISNINTGTADQAYAITDQRQWYQYNVEQQADLIAGWYRNGSQPHDWRFRYVDQNIRRGDPNRSSSPVDTGANTAPPLARLSSASMRFIRTR